MTYAIAVCYELQDTFRPWKKVKKQLPFFFCGHVKSFAEWSQFVLPKLAATLSRDIETASLPSESLSENLEISLRSVKIDRRN